MQRLKTLSEIYQKRLIRPDYAHHQATPYSIALDPSLFNTDGSIRVPLSSDTTPLTRSVTAFTSSNSLTPGLVLVRTTGELVTVATGANAVEQPFGLLANWIGGDFDEIGPNNVGSGSVGAWRGPDSTFVLLAPGYVDTGLATALATNNATGTPTLLYAGTDGRLIYNGTPGSRVAVARCIDRIGTSRILVELVI